MFQQDSSISIKKIFLCTLIHIHIKEGDRNVVTIHLFSRLILVAIAIFSHKKGQPNVAASMHCDNYYAISTLTPFLNEKSTPGCRNTSRNYVSFH